MTLARSKLCKITFLVTLVLTACTSPETGNTPIPGLTSPNQPTTVMPTQTAVQPIERPQATTEPATIIPEPTELPAHIFIEGGEFLMGNSEGDIQAKEGEYPQHPVVLPGYWIMSSEVTNEEYQECVVEGECAAAKEGDQKPDSAESQLPVTGVNWKQAEAYCKAHNGRLPTEAEWEKARRGDNGNAGEWVSDWYSPSGDWTEILFQPTGPVKGIVKVVRWGSEKATEIGSRTGLDPYQGYVDVGFRCVTESKTYLPFCRADYRAFCQPPTGESKPNECISGTMNGNGGISSLGFDCPIEDGVGVVSVVTSEPVSGLSVMVNDIDLECSTNDKKTFKCGGKVQESQTDVVVRVCINYEGVFYIDTDDRVVSCTNYYFPTAIGDTIEYSDKESNRFFNTGLDLHLDSGIKEICPPGYIWNNQTGGCVVDVKDVNKSVKKNTKSCPVGYMLDLNLNCCLPMVTDGGTCGAGNYQNEAGLCIPILENGCSAGSIYDPYVGCIQEQEKEEGDGTACPSGTQLSPDGVSCLMDEPEMIGTLTCPNGLEYIEGSGCVIVEEEDQDQCPENSYYDPAAKICKGLNTDSCPEGTYLDEKFGVCLPTAGPWTGCQSGYMINPMSGCCVPVPGKENSGCLTRKPREEEVTSQETKILAQYYQLGQPGCPQMDGLVCGSAYHLNQAGTVCIPNTECPEGTGPTVDNPNGCFPGEEGSCPAGYLMTDTGLGCVPDMKSGTDTYECSTSQYFDPRIGVCLDRAGDCCAQGFYYDKGYAQCLPYPQEDSCPTGYILEGKACVSALFSSSNCFNFGMTVPKCASLTCATVKCSNTNCPLDCCQWHPTPKFRYQPAGWRCGPK